MTTTKRAPRSTRSKTDNQEKRQVLKKPQRQLCHYYWLHGSCKLEEKCKFDHVYDCSLTPFNDNERNRLKLIYGELPKETNPFKLQVQQKN